MTILKFTGKTVNDIDADTALENTKNKLDGFILAGYSKDGDFWFSTTYGDAGKSLLLCEQFKRALLDNLEANND